VTASRILLRRYFESICTVYASQHIQCLSQARINWEGCARKGIRYKNRGMADVGAPISQDGLAVHPDCWCICLCYLHFAPDNAEDGEPEDWKSSVVLTIFKGKGDPMEYGSYRGIKLLEHAKKVVD